MDSGNEQRRVWLGLLWASAAWVSHFVVLFIIFVTFVICVPAVEFMYDTLDMDLPSITILFLAFSNLMVNYWYLLVVPLFLDFAFLIGASLSGPKLRFAARAWSALVLFGTVLLLGMTLLATSLPFQEYARLHADADNAGRAERAQRRLEPTDAQAQAAAAVHMRIR